MWLLLSAAVCGCLLASGESHADLEGPPHLKNMTITDNVFTACGGFYGQTWATGMHTNCSGLNNGTNLPTYAYNGHATDGFCTGVGGAGAQLPTTCDMRSMIIKGNRPPSDCTVFGDPGAQATCCNACGPLCAGCCFDKHTTSGSKDTGPLCE